MTQDVYMGCKLVDGRAAEALEVVFGRVELSGNIDPLEGKRVGDSMWVAIHPEMDRHPFRAQSCAVRDLNPEPADSDYSLMRSCGWLWKPLRRNEIRRISPLAGCG